MNETNKIREVVQDPNPILHKTAEKITDFNSPDLQNLIKEMRKTLRAEDGAGLAAPQINVSKSVFVIPEEYAPKVRTIFIPASLLKPLQPSVYINPEIIEYSEDKEVVEEGCLSIKGKYHPTPRSYKVTLRAQNEDGRKFTVEATGLLARIFQHETDHLNGVLFTERI